MIEGQSDAVQPGFVRTIEIERAGILLPSIKLDDEEVPDEPLDALTGSGVSVGALPATVQAEGGSVIGAATGLAVAADNRIPPSAFE